MSKITDGVVTVKTNKAGLAEFEHGLGFKPKRVATAIIEDPAKPGPVAFLVTSWDDTRITGLLMDRVSAQTAGEAEVEMRWEAEAA